MGELITSSRSVFSRDVDCSPDVDFALFAATSSGRAAPVLWTGNPRFAAYRDVSVSRCQESGLHGKPEASFDQ